MYLLLHVCIFAGVLCKTVYIYIYIYIYILVFKNAQNTQIQIHPAHAQSHLGICYPLIHSLLSNNSVRGQ